MLSLRSLVFRRMFRLGRSLCGNRHQDPVIGIVSLPLHNSIRLRLSGEHRDGVRACRPDRFRVLSRTRPLRLIHQTPTIKHETQTIRLMLSLSSGV